MSASANSSRGLDLAGGVDLAKCPEDGLLLGQVGAEAALLVRHRGECFVTGAVCTHYGGPLAEGIVADGTLRCPWHHAAFSLHTGEAARPPGARADSLLAGRA